MVFDLTVEGRADGILINDPIEEDDFSVLILEEESRKERKIRGQRSL